MSKSHGFRKAGKWTPEYWAWQNMKRRVFRPTKKDGPNYTYLSICERWLHSFENFLEDMGLRPAKGYSLDRIDNFKGYEPGNCRWGTALQQARNSRQCKLTAGQILEIRDLRSLGYSQQKIADMFGVHQTTVSDIILGNTWR